MTSKEVAEEDLFNEFHEALSVGNYSRASEIIRLVRSELRKDISLLDRTPLAELLSLIRDVTDEEFKEEVALIFEMIIDITDEASLLSTYGILLPSLLDGSEPAISLIGLSFVKKILNYPHECLLTKDNIEKFTNLAIHPSLKVADKISQIIIGTKWKKVFIPFLQALKLNTIDTVFQVRISGILAKIESQQTNWTEINWMINSKDDQLIIMTGLQQFCELFMSSEIKEMEESGIVQNIFRIASTDFVEDDEFIRSMAISSLSVVFRCSEASSITRNYNFDSLFNQIVCKNSENLLASALLLLVAIWSQENHFEPPYKITLLNLALDSHNIQVQETFLSSLIIAFDDTTVNDQKAREIYNQIDMQSPRGFLKFILERSQSLDDSVKTSAYNVLNSACRRSLIATELVKFKELTDFLLNRSQDSSLVGIHGKFTIIKTLSKVDELDAPLLEKFNIYIKQGISYSPRSTQIASESR